MLLNLHISIQLVQSTGSAWEEQGLAKCSKLQKNKKKIPAKIWLESSICKALRWVLASEKFDRRARKLKYTYRKPLPGSNGGTESGKGKAVPQTPGETQGDQWDPEAKHTPCNGSDEQSSSSTTAASSPLGKGPKGPTLCLVSRKGWENLRRSAKNNVVIKVVTQLLHVNQGLKAEGRDHQGLGFCL